MQILSSTYNKAKHAKFKGIRVLQPYADAIAEGKQGAVLMPKDTNYRGDVMIVSGGRSNYDTRQGMTICLVELYGTKPASEMTENDREMSGYGKDIELKGFCFLLSNPRKVIELPARGHQGLFNIVFDKGDIIAYPYQSAPEITNTGKKRGLIASLVAKWRL